MGFYTKYQCLRYSILYFYFPCYCSLTPFKLTNLSFLVMEQKHPLLGIPTRNQTRLSFFMAESSKSHACVPDANTLQEKKNHCN